MPSSYPTGLDSLPTNWVDYGNPGAQLVTAAFLNLLDDAVNKIQAELGTDPSGSYSTVVARLNSSASPTSLYDVFTGKGTVSLGTSDSGQTWTKVDGGLGAPSIVSGFLTSSGAGTGGGYAQVQLASNVTRLGGRFAFSSGSSTAQGSATFAIWKTSITGWPTIPDSPCHLSITRTTWSFSVWTGNAQTVLASGGFASQLLDDGTLYRAEVTIKGTTATILLPDGSVRTITDSRISSNAGVYASYEPFKVATTDALAKFAEVWADNVAPALYERNPTVESLLETIEMVRRQTLPTTTVWSPASLQTIAVPTSSAVIDATNLALTVVFPQSGKLLIELSGFLSMTGSARVLWSLFDPNNSTTYAAQSIVNQQYTGRVRYVNVLTGNAGSIQTFQWKHLATVGSVASILIDNPNGYQAVMKATPIG